MIALLSSVGTSVRPQRSARPDLKMKKIDSRMNQVQILPAVRKALENIGEYRQHQNQSRPGKDTIELEAANPANQIRLSRMIMPRPRTIGSVGATELVPDFGDDGLSRLFQLAAVVVSFSTIT